MAEDQGGISGFIVKNMTGIGAVMVSASVGYAGYSINQTNQEVAAINSCYERTGATIAKANSFVAAGSNRPETQQDIELRQLAYDAEFVEFTCKRANRATSEVLALALREASRLAPQGKDSAQLQQTANAMSGSDVSVAPVATAPAPRNASDASPRLFIQISDESQRGAAQTLKPQLEQAPLGGRPLRVEAGIEKASPVNSNQLRCLTKSDCAQAPELANAISERTGIAGIQVINLSARYANRTDIKPGTYELWLAADAFMPPPSN